ncbi:MAG: tetratricopeptide repeat protein, partial [Anaerolineales bacterium]|nr:tetratricopeptide repeat protein [Anaerolineales bacterium]
AWEEQCRRAMLEALQKCANHVLQQDQLEQAEAYARRQLAIDALHEPGHQQLITILARSRRAHEAVTHFEAYARLLRHELALPPSAEMTALVADIRAGEMPLQPETGVSHLPPAASSPAALAAVPNNLYSPSTPFVGRVRELEELDEWLSSPAVRLINIMGPGGIGKTRLAVMTADRQLTAVLDGDNGKPRFPDGVYFVSLAPLRNEEDIIPAIIKAINLKLERAQQAEQSQEIGQSAQVQLLNHLHDKQMLLVMNNYEHLLGGTRILVEMLRAAPAVHILVTSRERLQLHGEQVYLLQGLDFPAAYDLPDDDAGWQAYPAVQLFLQSARRIRPDFAPADDEWAHVGQICQWVEGLPLGLELAASWVDVMSPADIVTEIRNSLDFLETELRDLPPRHRSMRAVFDYTWQRLNPTEQAALSALSVLEDGFSRAAAQHITGVSLRVLANLVNKSLLRYSTSQDQFETHALVRQYAADKLAADQVRETAVRDHHAAYYCQWLHQQHDILKGAEQQSALAQIDIAGDNIRAAWEWAVLRRQWSLLAAALESQSYFYWWRGRLHRGLSTCKQLVAAITHNQPNPDRQAQSDGDAATSLLLATALAWQGLFTQLTGQADSATRLLQNSIAILETLETTSAVQAVRAFTMLQIGYNQSIHNHEQARTAFKQCLQIYESLGDRSGQAAALLALGRTEGRLGAFAQAQQWLAQSRRILHELGDQRGLADVAALLCRIALFTGRIDEAVALGEESVSIVASLGLRTELKQGILAFALQLRGDVAVGAAMQQKAMEAELRRGVQYGLLVVRTAMGHLLNGAYALAHEQAQLAYNLAQKEGLLRVQAMAAQVSGMAALAQNDLSAALAHLHDAPIILYQLDEINEASWVQGTYADVLWRSSEREAALAVLQQALDTAVSIRSYISLLFILPPLMRIKLEQGNTEHA